MIKIQLYDRTKVTSGYLDVNGDIQNDLDAYWTVTDYMYVEPGAHCIYSGISYLGSKQYAAFYDKFQHLISTFRPTSDETEIVIPNDVYYVRFSLCKHTKINLYNDKIETGSINYISGSNEAGSTFRRNVGDDSKITVSTSSIDTQLEVGQEYTLSTTSPVKQMTVFYYRNTPTGVIYDSCVDTEFNVELDRYTFTIPNNENICQVRTRFYNPDDVEFNIMLNLGNVALEYTPATEYDSDDRYTFSFEIITEAFQSFRDDLYNYLKTTLSANLTTGDLDIIIRLMCYIFGDLTGVTYKLPYQVDPDKAEEEYLRHLCTIIGYEWEEGLTAEQQRESIKMFIDIRRKRGTPWSLQNLISVFGQDRTSFYSTSDLRGVRIVECMSDERPDRNGLYPGDLMIEVPQFSNILRKAIDNIRLIGTRIIFTYMIYCGVYRMKSVFSADREVSLFFDPAYWGYDPKIKDFGPVGEDTEIKDVLDWPIVHRVRNAVSNCKCVIYTAYAKPYERGFVWHPQGNDNYKGFLVDDETLKDEDTMYGYGTK